MKVSIDTGNALPSPLASAVYGMGIMLAFLLLDIITAQTGVEQPPRDFVLMSAISTVLILAIHVARCMIFLTAIAIAAMAANSAALERSVRDEMSRKGDGVSDDKAH